jgi:hypothetical protein
MTEHTVRLDVRLLIPADDLAILLWLAPWQWVSDLLIWAFVRVKQS